MASVAVVRRSDSLSPRFSDSYLRAVESTPSRHIGLLPDLVCEIRRLQAALTVRDGVITDLKTQLAVTQADISQLVDVSASRCVAVIPPPELDVPVSLRGSTEMISDTLEQLAWEDTDRRGTEHADAEAAAQLQFLYDLRQGVCEYCGQHIAQPAEATILHVSRAGRPGFTPALIHITELFQATLQLSGALAAIRKGQ